MRIKFLGFTLVEIMISLVLSFVILATIMSLYNSIEKIYDQNNETHQSQNNLLIATHVLRDAIKMAGYSGYLSSKHFFSENKIKIYHLSDYSDAIQLMNMSIDSSELIKSMTGFTTLYLSSSIKLHKNDMLFIQDIYSTEMARIKEIENYDKKTQKIVLIAPLSKKFLKSAEVHRLENKVFFVAPTKRKTKKGDVIFALYLQEVGREKEELVEGIKSMHVIADQVGVKIYLSTKFNKLDIYAAFKN